MNHSVKGTLYYGAPSTPYGSLSDWCIDALSCPPEVIWNFRKVAVETDIFDLRAREDQPALDQAGFQRVRAPTAVEDDALFALETLSLGAYYRELETILRSLTAADDIVFFDATVRSENTDAPRDEGIQPAHLRVHVDQNPRSAMARAEAHGGAGRTFARFQIVNAWRPLTYPVRNYALAFCDFRSLDLAQDLVPTRLKFPPWLRDKENYSVRANPSHRWGFWDRLTPDELLVFKCYDSGSRSLSGVWDVMGERALLDVAGLCPHSAFYDAAGFAHGHLRTSLEVRALLFYA